MKIIISDDIILEEWYCPIHGRIIDAGLCLEISNFGSECLRLNEKEHPACSWDEAHEICNQCKHYADWE